MVPTAIEGSVRLEELYENLWIVDKQAYDTCAVNTSKHGNKILMKCDTPLQLRFFGIVFQSVSALPDGLVFEPGKEYFFIGKEVTRSIPSPPPPPPPPALDEFIVGLSPELD